MDLVSYNEVDGGEVPITQEQYLKLFSDSGLTMPEETNNDKKKFKEKYKNIFPQHLLNNPNVTIHLSDSKSTKDNVLGKPTLDTNLYDVSGQGEPMSNVITEPRPRSQSPDLLLLYSFQDKETSYTSAPVQTVVASTSIKANVHVKQEKQPILEKTQLLLNNKQTGKPTSDTNLDDESGRGEPMSNSITEPRPCSQSPDRQLIYYFQDKETTDTLAPVQPVVASTSINANVDDTNRDDVNDHGEPSTSNDTNELGSSENRNLKIFFFENTETQETSDTLDPENQIETPNQFFRFVLNETDILEIHNPDFVNEMLSNLRNLMKKELTVAQLAALEKNKSSFFPQE